MFFAPIPPPSLPQPVIREDVRYYTIEGRSEPELVAQLNAKGYLTPDGRYWGFTSPALSWRFDTKPADGRCHLVNATVVLIVTTTLPVWAPPAGTPAALRVKWHAFDQAIHHHEGEHAQIDQDEARELAALMRTHAIDVSCRTLAASLQAQGKVIMQKSAAANAELDARTQHGATEGVAISW